MMDHGTAPDRGQRQSTKSRPKPPDNRGAAMSVSDGSARLPMALGSSYNSRSVIVPSS